MGRMMIWDKVIYGVIDGMGSYEIGDDECSKVISGMLDGMVRMLTWKKVIYGFMDRMVS